jgi:integration host factor subunit alpha
MTEETVTRAYLTEALYLQVGISRAESAEFVAGWIDCMVDGLARDHLLKIPHFGSFQVQHKRPRMGRNPKTGEAQPIAARNVTAYRPALSLKQATNANFKQNGRS